MSTNTQGQWVEQSRGVMQVTVDPGYPHQHIVLARCDSCGVRIAVDEDRWREMQYEAHDCNDPQLRWEEKERDRLNKTYDRWVSEQRGINHADYDFEYNT